MKTFLFLLSVLMITTAKAQKPEKAQELFKANKIAEAKTEIDNFLADTKNQKNAEAWYIKSKIYTAVSVDPALLQKFPGALKEAFAAVKKYTEYDDKMLISLQIDGYKPINDIYTNFYQLAANSFNNKQYEKSLENFSNAIMVFSFMNEKSWIPSTLDTNSVLYAGVSAEKLNRMDEAASYYARLIEARVKGDGFVEIYKWVANHHYEKKDEALASKYIGIGKEVYPSDPFWASIELDRVRDKGNKDALFQQYEKTISAEPSNHLYRYNFAVELYQQGYNTDLTRRPSNSESLIRKAETQIAEALRLKPDYARGGIL